MELDIAVPEALKDLKGWLVWRLSHKEGVKKPLKMPFYVGGKPRSGTQGSADDRANMRSFDEALTYAKDHNYTGVGLAMLPEWNITALDFDNCIEELTGDIHPEVLAAIQGTYAEVSPSGTGVRAFIIGSHGNLKSLSKEEDYGFELFSSTGFVTLTGNVINNCEISNINPAALSLLCRRFTEKPTILASEPSVDLSTISHALKYLNSSVDYPGWVQIGMAIHYESNGSEEGFQLWDSWSANADNYPTEEFLRDKWDTFNGAGRTPVTGKSILHLARRNGMPDTPLEFAPLKEGEVSNFFNIRPVSQFMTEHKAAEWIIKDVLPKAGLGIIYGESGAGKSFIALDICSSIARHAPWNGIKTQLPKAKILYVVAEGATGFTKRIKAYCDANYIRPDHLNIDIISDVSPNLVDGISVDHLIRDMECHGPYDLIVMDTFAQVTAGSNENSGEDMGKALNYCKRIHGVTGAMVILVHHSGKDSSKGARGHSSLVAAADVIISVSREEEDRKLKIVKMKDGDDMKEYGFKLAPYVVGTDSEGDDITSCVIEYCDVVVNNVSSLKAVQKSVYEAMLLFSKDVWVSFDHLIELTIEHIPLKDGQRDQRKIVIKRAIKSMVGTWLLENENHEVKLKVSNQLIVLYKRDLHLLHLIVLL